MKGFVEDIGGTLILLIAAIIILMAAIILLIAFEANVLKNASATTEFLPVFNKPYAVALVLSNLVPDTTDDRMFLEHAIEIGATGSPKQTSSDINFLVRDFLSSYNPQGYITVSVIKDNKQLFETDTAGRCGDDGEGYCVSNRFGYATISACGLGRKNIDRSITTNTCGLTENCCIEDKAAADRVACGPLVGGQYSGVCDYNVGGLYLHISDVSLGHTSCPAGRIVVQDVGDVCKNRGSSLLGRPSLVCCQPISTTAITQTSTAYAPLIYRDKYSVLGVSLG